MQRKKQQGVALITAMVITAIVVTISATLVYRQQVSLRLAANLAALEQAYEYASGMEDWAGIILSNDFQSSTHDSLDEEWSSLLPPIPIPGGSMTGQLFDLQARINLNEVLTRQTINNQLVEKVEPVTQGRLEKLLDAFDLDTTILMENLLDWIDSDTQQRTYGNESAHYKALKTPYLTADGDIVNLSELRTISGFDESKTDLDGNTFTVYSLLAPYLAAYPRVDKNKPVSINVNTAPEEVLLTIAGMDKTAVDNVLTDREAAPFQNIQDFVNSTGIPSSANFKTDRLDIKTDYFLLEGKVQIDNVRVFMNSVLYRDGAGRVRVIYREYNKQT